MGNPSVETEVAPVEAVIEQHAANKPEQSEFEAAKALLEQAKKSRVETCQHEINAALERHSCKIVASFILTPPNRIVPVIDIAPAE